MEQRTRNAGPEESWVKRGALAVKVGSLLTVLAVIAVAGTHLPLSHEASPGQVSAAAVAAAAPDTGSTYFPSQYPLNAPEPGEPAPTF